MKKILVSGLLLAVVALSSVSCKKTIENAVASVVTSNTWTVSNFMVGSTDSSSFFVGWIANFKSDNTLVLTKGSTTVSGTWSSPSLLQSFTASVPASAPTPLPSLNGSWTVTSYNNAGTSAVFTQTKNGVVYNMQITQY